MKALISPNEQVFKYDGSPLGSRIAEVSETEFAVAEPLFWQTVASDVVADQWYWDGTYALQIPAKPLPIE